MEEKIEKVENATQNQGNKSANGKKITNYLYYQRKYVIINIGDNMKDVSFLVENGIDVKGSLELFGDMDMYNETASDFLNSVSKKLADIKKYKGEADVIIDFASAGAIDNLIDYSRNTGIPVVVCTTGLSKEQVARLEELSKSVAVLYSANSIPV